MDTGDTQTIASLRGDSSSRRGSLSMWRQHGDDVFSRSRSFSRESVEDDEEALRWAAIEKLPTFVRLQRAVLPPVPDDAEDAAADGGADGPAAQRPAAATTARAAVDVRGLGPHERRALLERLVHVAEEDNERFLQKLKDRVERVGLDVPTIEVRFEHLQAEAEVRVGSSGLPTILNSVTNTLEEAANAMRILPSRKRTMSILHDVSGIIKPRR